jgi:hypothetical protein
MTRVKIFILQFVCLMVSVTVSAATDPTIDWQITESEHFDIIHDAKHKELAQEYANTAEKAYQTLLPVFREAPSRTVLWINDTTDIANGWATAFPYSTIAVYPVLPASQSSVGEYSEWIDQLVLHEYTHILNFEPANGIWSPFRFVFGNIVRPNALLPVWYMEGMAVETESRYTHAGRLKSNYYRALIRSLVLDDKWGEEDIADINELRTPTWPRGLRPYFFGSLLWHEMTIKKSEKIMGKLNQRYAGRVPFFINGPAEDEFGKNYSQLLEEMYSKKKLFALDEMAQIKRHKTTSGQAFKTSQNTISMRKAVISRNQKNMVYIKTTAETDDQIILLKRRKSRTSFLKVSSKVVAEKKNIDRLSWFPDSKRIVFSATDTVDRYYTLADLYITDTQAGKTEKITEGLRAREPSVSPDGVSIAFIKQEAGISHLAMVNAKGQGHRILYSPALGSRVSHPAFLNNDEIIFSERLKNGKEYLRIYDLTNLDTRTVLSRFQPARNPQKTPDGVVFVSERTGVSNLYITNLFQNAEPLTNSLTQVTDGTIDSRNRKLYYSELTGSGPRLKTTALISPPMNPRPILNPDKYEWPAPNTQKQAVKTTTGDYSAWPYILPHYWMPFFLVIPDGVSFSASTSSADPVGHHFWGLDVGTDTLTEEASVSFNYVNQQTPMTLSIYYASLYTYIYGSESTSHNQYGQFDGGFYLPGLSSKWRGGFGFLYASSKVEDLEEFKRLGPSLSFSYSNSSQKGLQISPESGQEASVNYTYFIPEVNQDSVGYSRTTVSGSQYLSSFLPKRHAIALRTHGFFTPRNRNVLLGTTSTGGEALFSMFESPQVVRGYPTGEFIGWTMITAGLEYRFPLAYPFAGSGTLPLFLRKLHAALVVDGVTLEGGYYDADLDGVLKETKLGTTYWGTGLELRLDTTALYHVPLRFRLGLFYGLNAKAYGQFQPVLGVTLPTLDF